MGILRSISGRGNMSVDLGIGLVSRYASGGCPDVLDGC